VPVGGALLELVALEDRPALLAVLWAEHREHEAAVGGELSDEPCSPRLTRPGRDAWSNVADADDHEAKSDELAFERPAAR
jgi:hypothetical protein